MEKECWRDTLSKYFIYTALAVVIGAICRYARHYAPEYTTSTQLCNIPVTDSIIENNDRT